MKNHWKKLRIDSFAELMKHEKEILKRIGDTPNGGNLFMIHPLMLFEDIGVMLSKKATVEVIKHEPHLSALSALPYKVLKASKAKQLVRFNIKGLFKKSAR